MPEISIKWLSDYSDCETCGGNYAEGAEVRLDGNRVLNLVPRAHCFGGDHYDEDEVYRQIFDLLGYELEILHD